MKLLRILFVFGFLITFVMSFIPIYHFKNQEASLADRSANAALEAQVGKTFSTYGLVRYLVNSKPGVGVIFVVLMAIPGVYFILGIAYLKRWVFLSGAIYTALMTFYNLFQKTSVKTALIFTVIGLAATIMQLTGFFIFPKKAERTPLPAS